MSQISLSVCPICNAQDSLSLEKMEFKGQSHEWLECGECGSALLWLGDDQWAYQKVGREDKAHLLKKPMSEEELLALLPEAEEAAPLPEASDEAEPEEESVTSLFSADWPEYDEDPFAFLFRSRDEEAGPPVPLDAEEQAQRLEPEPSQGIDEWLREEEPQLAVDEFEEATEPVEPALAAEPDEVWGDEDSRSFAALFDEEWPETTDVGQAPAHEEEAGGGDKESPALFSQAWFDEIDRAEQATGMEEETPELQEEVPARSDRGDRLAREADTPTLVAAEQEVELQQVVLEAEVPDDLHQVEVPAPVTPSRDVAERPRGRSSLGKVIPWLLALCLIAFLFLVAIGVYQLVTGNPLF